MSTQQLAILAVKITAENADLVRTLGASRAAVASEGQRMAADFRRSAAFAAPFIAGGIAATRFAMDSESALVQVRKTSGATADEVEGLAAEFRRLSESLAVEGGAEGLANIAAMGGQLGVAVADLDEFAEVVAKLDLSVESLTAEEAATGLAQFANIAGTSGAKFENLASALAEMGDAGASSERDILAMGLRLVGTGELIGLSEGQVLGMANALASVGLEAEAGGSAFSKVMADMADASAKNGREIANFAKVAGMDTAAFQQLFKTDSAGAIVAFVQGLDRIQKSGGNVFEVLEKMGFQEVRVRDALLRATQAGDTLRTSMEGGARAFQENTKLAREAAAANETTAASLTRLGNAVKNRAVEFGSQFLPGVRASTEELQAMLPSVSALNSVFSAAAAVIAGRFVGALSSSTVAIARKGLASMSAAREAVKAAQADIVQAQSAHQLAVRHLSGAQAQYQMARAQAAATGSSRILRQAAIELRAAQQGVSLTARGVAASQTAAAAAMVRASVASRALALGASAARGALALVGGVPGLLIGGLTLLAFHFQRTGEKAREAAAEARQAAQEFREALAAMDTATLEAADASAEARWRMVAQDLEAQRAEVERLRAALPEQTEGAAQGGGTAVSRQAQEFAEAQAQLQTLTNQEREAREAVRATTAEIGKRNSALAETPEAPPKIPVLTGDEDAKGKELENALREVQAAAREVRFGWSDNFAEAEQLRGRVEDLKEALDRAGDAAPAAAREQLAQMEADLARMENRWRSALATFQNRSAPDVTLAATEIQRRAPRPGAAPRATDLPGQFPVQQARQQMAALRRTVEDLQAAREQLRMAVSAGDSEIAASARSDIQRLMADVRNMRGPLAEMINALPKDVRVKLTAEFNGAVEEVETDTFEQSVQVAEQGLADIAAALGELGRPLQLGISGLAAFANGIAAFQKSIATGGLAGIAGTIGAVGQMVGGVMSLVQMVRAADAENLAMMSANTQALRSLEDTIRGSVTFGESGGILEFLQGVDFQNIFDTPRFARQLAAAGLSLEDLQRVAESLNIDIVNDQGHLVAGALQQLEDALRASALSVTEFSRTLENQRKLSDVRMDILEIEDPTQLLQEQVRLLMEGLSERAETQFGFTGLDLTSAGGQQALEQAIRDLFASFERGEVDAAMLAGFSSVEEFLEALRGTDNALDRLRETTDRVSGALLNVPQGVKVALARFDATQVGDPVIPPPERPPLPPILPPVLPPLPPILPPEPPIRPPLPPGHGGGGSGGVGEVEVPVLLSQALASPISPAADLATALEALAVRVGLFELPQILDLDRPSPRAQEPASQRTPAGGGRAAALAPSVTFAPVYEAYGLDPAVVKSIVDELAPRHQREFVERLRAALGKSGDDESRRLASLLPTLP